MNLIAVENESGDAARFEKAVKLAAERSGLACLVMSAKAENLRRAAAAVAGQRPLLYIFDTAQAEAAASCQTRIARWRSAPTVWRPSRSLPAGSPPWASSKSFWTPAPGASKRRSKPSSKIRRLGLKSFRPLGYPAMAVTASSDPTMQAAEASTYIAKYAGIVVTDAYQPWQLLPVLTTRQDIYTDPQKPVAVEPKLYSVGAVGADSPLLVTTNFSLSYYSVEGEVEASRVPAYVLAVDTEGPRS